MKLFFFFIVFFLYLEIINWVSVSLQTHNIKILFSFKPDHNKGLAVQLLKSVQNECKTSITDEVKIIADKILS
jgi:hypothetical protein